MNRLEKLRSGKPGFYPDQSIYAAFACAEFGLDAVRDQLAGRLQLSRVHSVHHLQVKTAQRPPCRQCLPGEPVEVPRLSEKLTLQPVTSPTSAGHKLALPL